MERRASGHLKIDGWKGLVVASDEVGYGAWAGPLVVCAASAPLGWDDARVRDSKLVDKEQEREKLYEKFFSDPQFPNAVVVISSEALDRMGVYQALLHAHRTALQKVAKGLAERPLGVVDGSLPVHEFIEVEADLVALPKGDQLVPECSLASILAKVSRDRMMIALDKQFPGFGFSANKGYGTPPHQEALKKLGPCPQHRTSYAPIAKMIAEREEAGQLKNGWELLE